MSFLGICLLSMTLFAGGICCNSSDGYQLISPNLAPEGFLEQTRSIRESGGEFSLVHEDKTYIYIASGQRPTLGYSIQVTDVDFSENTVRVTYEELRPERGAMVAQVITYPEISLVVEGKWNVSFVRKE